MKRDAPRVAVIGGGIFGVSCAVELARAGLEVTLFEQNAELLRGATFANHNRHHYGYHYPRSLETARQCQRSRESFEQVYGQALVWDFDNYYGVAQQGSKTTPDDYLKFCREAGLFFEEAAPPDGVADVSKLALCVRVREAVYEFERLQAIARAEIESTKARVCLSRRVTGVELIDSGLKRVSWEGGSGDFEFAVNATYANSNLFCEWLGFPRREFQYNLQELCVIELPGSPRVGITIQDGSYPSFIPLGRTRRYLLAHVDASQLVRDSSNNTLPLLSRTLNIVSNWEGVQAACAQYLPIVSRARYVRSIFVDRVVDATRAKDDARISGVTAHGQGCWSIFSAKVITSIETARRLREEILDGT